MRDASKFGTILAICISIGLLTALVLTGAGKFAYITALVLVGLNIVLGLIKLAIS